MVVCRYLSLGKSLFKLFWFLGYVFAFNEFVVKYFSILFITQCGIGLTHCKSWDFLEFR